MGGWNFIDRTNMTFGKLRVEKYLGNKKWLCLCECGNYCVVDSDHLRVNSKNRNTQSCGCLRKSRLIKNINYFNQIDKPEKAYILGFLAADGTITWDLEKKTYSVKIVVNSIDYELLEKFKKEFDTKVEIKTYKVKTKLP